MHREGVNNGRGRKQSRFPMDIIFREGKDSRPPEKKRKTYGTEVHSKR
jgi:hypothetical protein